MTAYLALLGLTIAAELLVALLVIPRALWRTRIFDVVLANLVTHPLATLAVWRFSAPWLVAEACVAAAEAVIYRFLSRFLWGRALRLSVCCNAVTAAASFFV